MILFLISLSIVTDLTIHSHLICQGNSKQIHEILSNLKILSFIGGERVGLSRCRLTVTVTQANEKKN